MVKNTDFLGSRDPNPYNFRHYDLTNFTMYVNGRQIPSESLSRHESRENVRQRLRYTVRKHRHSPLELRTPDNSHVYKWFLHDSVPSYAGSGSVGRSRLAPTSGDNRIDLKFAKALPEAVTCLLYLEYDNSIRIDLARNVSTDFS